MPARESPRTLRSVRFSEDTDALTSIASIDPELWSGRDVLVTGHTGFKGSWLALWLQSLGARVSGLAPAPPTEPSLYALARVGEHMHGERSLDIRDARAVRELVGATSPTVVFHLAAQPLVRLSLREPLHTFEVNVLGTANLLDAVRLVGDSVQAVVVVTSDKCYAHGASSRRFVEDDRLGGSDPYSSSKACAELVTAAYRESYFNAASGAAAAATGAGPGASAAVRVASARAGNVIGGGDFGEDRLIPDILRARAAGRPVAVRNPDAVRPWQHVLNPISGYLLLAQALCGRQADVRAGDAARAWNFGPPARDCRSVREIVERLAALLDGGLRWELDSGANPPEARRLELDSSAACGLLGWRPQYGLDDALAQVAAWDRAERTGEDMRRVALEQIARFAAPDGLRRADCGDGA